MTCRQSRQSDMAWKYDRQAADKHILSLELIIALRTKARGLNHVSCLSGIVAQLVACVAAYTGVASSIPVRTYTFVNFKIDHEIISTVILLLPLNHSMRVDVSYNQKYVH